MASDSEQLVQNWLRAVVFQPLLNVYQIYIKWVGKVPICLIKKKIALTIYLFLKNLLRACGVPSSGPGTENSKAIKFLVPAFQGVCPPGGARSAMFLSVVFHESQAPEARQDSGTNS